MKTFRIIRLAGALAAALVGHAPAFLENLALDPERISQTGQVLFEQLAPAAVQEEYEFASAEDIALFFANIQAGLTGEDVSSLSVYLPQARQTLAAMQADPKSQAAADWLLQRMDFFEMAAEVERAIPAPKPTPPPTAPLPPHPASPQKPLPPHPTTPQKSLPPHPTGPQPRLIPHPAEPAAASTPSAPPPAIEQARNRYVESRQVWVRKLAKRPAPARAAALLPELKRIFRAEGVPPELVWQAEAESTFNPAARSPAGAVGLYQFMPATARQFGLSLAPEDERLDALKNARAAAQYLRRLHERFGNWPLAFAAYNCGEGRVSKTLRDRNGQTFDDIHDKLPAETRMYVPKIAALVHLRENADLDRL